MLSAATAAKRVHCGLVRQRTWIETPTTADAPQRTLGRLTPIEFEILQQAARAA